MSSPVTEKTQEERRAFEPSHTPTDAFGLDKETLRDLDQVDERVVGGLGGTHPVLSPSTAP